MTEIKNPKILISTNLLGGHSWLFIVVQALITILLGVIFLLHPAWIMIVLALALGIMLLGNGIQQFALMILTKKFSFLILLYGLLLLLAGLFLVANPFLGSLDLLLILGIWFIFHAIELFVGAARAKTVARSIRTMAMVNGILSFLCGFFITLFPLAGIMWINLVFAFYLILYGVMTLAVGFKLRSISR